MVGSVSLSLFLYLSLYRSLLPCTSYYFFFFFSTFSVFTASSPISYLSRYPLCLCPLKRGTSAIYYYLPSTPSPPPPHYYYEFEFLRLSRLSFFYSSRSPRFEYPSLLYFSFFFFFTFFTLSTSLQAVVSVFVFPRHEGGGVREGVEIS